MTNLEPKVQDQLEKNALHNTKKQCFASKGYFMPYLMLGWRRVTYESNLTGVENKINGRGQYARAPSIQIALVAFICRRIRCYPVILCEVA